MGQDLAWSPCIGPTLGAAIARASTGQDQLWSFLITLAHGGGLVVILTDLAFGGHEVIRRRKDRLHLLIRHASRGMGLACLAIAAFLLTQSDVTTKVWLCQNMPRWFFDLTTSL